MSSSNMSDFEFQNYENIYEHIEEHVQFLTGEGAKRNVLIDALREEIERMTSCNIRIRNDFMEIRNENDALKENYLRIKEQCESLAKKMAHTPIQNQQHCDTGNVLQLLHGLKAAHRKSMNQLLGDVAGLKNTNAQLKASNVELKKDNRLLGSGIANEPSIKKENVESTSAVDIDLSPRIRTSNIEIEGRKHTIHQLKSNNNELKKALKCATTTEHKGNNNTADSTKEDVSSVSDSFEESNEVVKQIAVLRSELDRLKHIITQLKGNNAELKRCNKLHETQLSALQNTANLEKTTTSTVEKNEGESECSTEKQLQTLRVEIDSHKHTNTQLRANNSELKRANKLLETECQLLKDKQSANETSTTDVGETKIDVEAKLRSEIDGLKNTNAQQKAYTKEIKRAFRLLETESRQRVETTSEGGGTGAVEEKGGENKKKRCRVVDYPVIDFTPSEEEELTREATTA